jgi:hypothetical protein
MTLPGHTPCDAAAATAKRNWPAGCPWPTIVCADCDNPYAQTDHATSPLTITACANDANLAASMGHELYHVWLRCTQVLAPVPVPGAMPRVDADGDGRITPDDIFLEESWASLMFDCYSSLDCAIQDAINSYCYAFKATSWYALVGCECTADYSHYTVSSTTMARWEGKIRTPPIPPF